MFDADSRVSKARRLLRTALPVLPPPPHFGAPIPLFSSFPHQHTAHFATRRRPGGVSLFGTFGRLAERFPSDPVPRRSAALYQAHLISGVDARNESHLWNGHATWNTRTLASGVVANRSKCQTLTMLM